MDSITQLESQRLNQLESIIEQGFQTFVDVGNALLEIRDNRLYRAEYNTFEDYCRERWGFTDRRARQLMSAAETVTNLQTGTIVPVFPQTESQARPLSKLTPQLQREVWPVVVDTAPGGKITAAHIQETIKKLSPNNNIVECMQCNNLYDGEKFPTACPYCWKDEPNFTEPWTKGLPEMMLANNPPHVSFNNGDNEWYTPKEYIEAALTVMSSIDLDPASSEIANSVILASEFYTAENSGLDYSWHGNVWMNPPYARELVSRFCDKLINHYLEGNVPQAITLTNNATETRWFQMMANHASALCLPEGRVQFWHPEKVSTPLQGQALLYFGPNANKFIYEFRKFGVVWLRLVNN